MLHRGSATILSVVCVAGSALAQLSANYRVIDLGDFGLIGPNEVESINDDDVVVGWNLVDQYIIDGTVRFVTRGAHWSGGTLRELASVADGEYSWATGINNDGLIVGRARRPDGQVVACVLDVDGPATQIGLPGGLAVGANAVNAFGLIVGGGILDDGRRAPFILDHATGLGRFLLGAAGTSVGAALAVNDAGAVVGTWSSGASTHVFYAAPGEDAIDLNSLLPPSSTWQLRSAVAISNSGWIAGDGLYNGAPRAFRGRFDGADPEPLPPLPGDLSSSVDGINEAGVAVGYSLFFELPGARWTGVMWTADEVIDINTRLIDPPADLWIEGIRGLNERGRLIARGVHGNGIRQLLLSPVCGADLDSDGLVDLQDLSLLLSCFGESVCQYDTDGDADVDLQDLATVLSVFGQTCG